VKKRNVIILFLLLLISICPAETRAQTNAASQQKQTNSQAASKQKQSTTKAAPKTDTREKDTVFFELPDSANYKSARTYWDELPEFPGGKDSLTTYVVNHTVYPESAINDKIEGRVFMRFAIEPDGSTSDIQIFIGVRSDLDNECIKTIREMPKWKPGTTVLRANKGWYRTKTKWMYSIPFTFSLTKSEKGEKNIITPK
jgi:TonB family protein